MLNTVEDYELTLIKEYGRNILTRLYRYQYIQYISFDDVTNPWILMNDDMSVIVNTNIYLLSTLEELQRYSRCIVYMLKKSEK